MSRYKCPECKMRYPTRRTCHVSADQLLDTQDAQQAPQPAPVAAAAQPPQPAPAVRQTRPATQQRPQTTVINNHVHVNGQQTPYTHYCRRCGTFLTAGYGCNCSDPLVDLIIAEELMDGDFQDAFLLQAMQGGGYGYGPGYGGGSMLGTMEEIQGIEDGNMGEVMMGAAMGGNMGLGEALIVEEMLDDRGADDDSNRNDGWNSDDGANDRDDYVSGGDQSYSSDDGGANYGSDSTADYSSSDGGSSGSDSGGGFDF